MAPNLVNVCGFVWEWTLAKYNSPLNIPGAFWGVLEGAQIQKSVEAVKRLDRLAPNVAHMCRLIWEWIYAKQIALRDTRGALGGFRGQTFKSLEKLSNGWTDWHQLWFTSVDSSGNGHRLNTSRPTIPQGAFGGGGFRGVTNSNVWGSCQTDRPIGTKFGTCLRIRLGVDIAKYNSPLNTTGGISEGFRGSQI